MKKVLLMSAAAAAMIFASCANGLEDEVPNPGSESSVAYMSIQLEAQKNTRGSTESKGNENDINTLYLITFDAVGNVVANPADNKGYHKVTSPSDLKLTPIKISGSSKNLVVVANPGAELTGVITGLVESSTYTTFNKAIAGVTATEMLDGKGGFAMITGGSDTSLNSGDQILKPYVDISTKIKVVTGTGAEADEAAKSEAAKPENRVTVKLERLASKLVVAAATKIVSTKDADAKVALNTWTVDVLNTTFYPFAEKTLISAAHTGSSYTKNFYTKDPNFVSDPVAGYATDLACAFVNKTTYEPELPWTNTTYPNGYYDWMAPAADKIAYVIENTMADQDQKVGNSTRIIMKATYFPKDFDVNQDWFSWAGTDYKTLADLQADYKKADAATDMKKACKDFYDKVYAYLNAKSIPMTGTDFATLTQTDLGKITQNGGEIVKNGSTPVIRWYQKGLCYYSYEVRHDNSATAGTMAFAKYGVVRNNWYNLTLKSVKGPGTPWYPDVKNPGPGDPNPEDSNDTQEGYLGVDVEIASWVLWATEMENID